MTTFMAQFCEINLVAINMLGNYEIKTITQNTKTKATMFLFAIMKKKKYFSYGNSLFNCFGHKTRMTKFKTEHTFWFFKRLKDLCSD